MIKFIKLALFASLVACAAGCETMTVVTDKLKAKPDCCKKVVVDPVANCPCKSHCTCGDHCACTPVKPAK